jgi:predicted RecB family nuclease
VSVREFTLDAYAARDCPVKVQNRFDATVVVPAEDDGRPSETQQGSSSEVSADLFAASDANRQEVYARLETALSAAGVAHIRVGRPASLAGSAAATVGADLASLADLAGEAVGTVTSPAEMTRTAVAEGVDVIIAPVLRSDYATHRTSSPDVLIRQGETVAGTPGYLPVQIKMHRVLGKTTRRDRSQLISRFGDPFVSASVELSGWAMRDSQTDDLLQLAHYWRHLEDLGWASATGVPFAGLIGTDAVPDGDVVPGPDIGPNPDAASRTDIEFGADVITWHDLGAKRLQVFARTLPSATRTLNALERYDHEFAFRVKVATTAQQRHGFPDDPPPMVQPVRIPECSRCQWWDFCAQQMGQADLSINIEKSPLDVRETLVLRNLGIVTVDDLAAANLDQLLPDYLPQVEHLQEAEERLRLASHRARLIAKGVDLERRADAGPIVVPRSRVEIDFDIETSRDSRVYLWGFLVREDAHDPRYVHFSRFEQLTARSEGSLAKRALTWLVGMLQEHPDAYVYHYSNYELIHIAKFRAQPSAQALLGEYSGRFVDLFDVVKRHFFGVHGLGLKAVASSGAGFSWRDEEASGLNSQGWFESAAFDEDADVRAAAQQRVLEYNEDDVRATLALREWLDTLE